MNQISRGGIENNHITQGDHIQSISDYLYCYINWQAVNYHILPRHANSPEWLILGWKNLPKSFYTPFKNQKK
jgi:hypothetical protein